MSSIIYKSKRFLDLIKFEHTIFALPFAYIGLLSASAGRPGWHAFVWVSLSMVSARTSAMLINRYADRKMDAINPRTKDRPSVTGEIPPIFQLLGAVFFAVLFMLCAASLNRLCLMLSPIALVLLSGYSYAKRFTRWCHFILGLVLAIAPIGGWIAYPGSWSWPPILLALAVVFWVAGFDILYSIQDADFDRIHGLHSIASSYGIRRAFLWARWCHITTGALFMLFGLAMGYTYVYLAGAATSFVLLLIEHKIISDEDLSHLNTAFFTINGWVGILLLIFVYMELYR